MSEPTPEPTPDQAAQPAEEPQDTTDWKAEARKWEQRAKENRTAATELEKKQRAAMTEAERAVAEAETRGRTAAASEFGQRLARSEFVAAAARRNPTWDAAAVLEDINLGRFVGEDGEPDTKAIAQSVDRLVPASDGKAPIPPMDLGEKRTAPGVPDMNSFIRKAAGRA